MAGANSGDGLITFGRGQLVGCGDDLGDFVLSEAHGKPRELLHQDAVPQARLTTEQRVLGAIALPDPGVLQEGSPEVAGAAFGLHVVPLTRSHPQDRLDGLVRCGRIIRHLDVRHRELLVLQQQRQGVDVSQGQEVGVGDAVEADTTLLDTARGVRGDEVTVVGGSLHRIHQDVAEVSVRGDRNDPVTAGQGATGACQVDDAQLVIETREVTFQLCHRNPTQVMHGALIGHLLAGINRLGQKIDADVHGGAGELLAGAFRRAVTHQGFAVDGVEQVNRDGVAVGLGEVGHTHDRHGRAGLALQLAFGGSLVGGVAGQCLGERRSLNNPRKERGAINLAG